MAVVVKEELMAPEVWGVDIDYTPVIHDLLTIVVDGKRRPRKLHALVYDADNTLVYPPLLLTAVDGDEKGLILSGVGPLWWLGSGGIGPMIIDREYVSGADKLDNGSFDIIGPLGVPLYWREASEDGMWVLVAGAATNAGGLGKDDALESERKFPTRPGFTYRARADGVTATGKLRLRTIYDGRFNPPDLLTNGNFEGGASVGWTTAVNLAIVATGARTGAYAMRVSPIPKPQLIAGSAFDSTAGWTVAPTHSITGGVLLVGPNTQPQYIADTGFETGGGWTDSIGPTTRPMSDDIDLINDPANAKTGSWVMAVGPVTQHQVFMNADFGSGLTNWYASSTDADPHAVWELDANGVNGTQCARTTGWSTAGRTGPETIKYLRADRVAGGGVETYAIAPGENYQAEAYFKGAPGTEGQAYISLMIPHPTVPGHDIWFKSKELEAPPMDDLHWERVTIENVNVPANRFSLNGLVEVHNHGLGYWYVDSFTVTRTRGNRAQINSDATYTVVPDTQYELEVLMRSGGEMQVGSVRAGVILSGAGLDDEIVDVDKGSTDYEWTNVIVSIRPRAGYTTARPFVAGLDIVGEPAYIDNITFTKVSNNTDVTTGTPVAVVPDQRYLLGAHVAAGGAVKGTVTVGVTLTGAGVPPQVVEINQDVITDASIKSISTEVRPDPGYTVATPFVRSTDVEGGIFIVDNVTLTKMDNNSDSSASTAIAVTPERTYRWLQAARSGPGLTKGTVKLSVRCTRAGHDDVTFDSSPMEATAGAWKFIDFSFTPPSGYDGIVPSIVGTDVEGDYWYLDDGELRDTDSATYVVDTVMSSPGSATANVDSTAPAGAEFVRVAVIVEQGTTSTIVGGVSLSRTGVALATGNAIVAQLLTDPTTNDPLSIVAGAISCPEVIPYDWVLQNLTNRDAFDHYCTVVSEPPREYRVLPTDPPSIDVGTQAAVFAVHDPADTLLPADRDVETLSNPETNVEERATEIVVLGAEFQTVSGRPFLITATAQVPGPVEYDYNDRPIVRTKQVSAGTVDHVGYAQAYATDLAEREAEPALALNVKLSGINTRADSPPGDTIYAFHPESGLEDSENVTTIDGLTVFPRAVRVLARERSLGPSYRIEMRSSDGATFPLPGVLWSDEDATMLTIGDRLPQWLADPQGQAEGTQYLRDRASRPR